MSGSNFNITNRIAKPKNPSREIDLFSAADFGPLTLAPDGSMRATLKENTTYHIHDTFIWPLLLMPKVASPGAFAFTTFTSFATSFNNILVNDTSAPIIWGRDISAINFQFLSVIDISNGGTGRGVDFIDLVGGNGNLSVLAAGPFAFVNLKSCANLVDVGLFYNDKSQTFGNEAGFTLRITPENAAQGQSHLIASLRFVGNALAPINRRPEVTYIGSVNEAVVNGNLVTLGLSGNSFVHIDSGTTEGNYNILGQSYRGGTSGKFFRPDEVEAITTQAADNINIIAVDDSFVAPGVDTTINFASIVDFIRGQVILLSGNADTNLNASHTIVRVADDQLSFDVANVFSPGAGGALNMVKHTVANCKFARDETITVTDTSNDGTFQVLRQTDTTFNTPDIFDGADVIGTATSTGKTQKTLGVICDANGAQPDSKIVASASSNGQSTASAAPVIDVYTAIDFGTVALGTISERVTLTDVSLMIFTYNGEAPVTLKISGPLNVNLDSGGSRDFRIAPAVNGVFPTVGTEERAPLNALGATNVERSIVFNIDVNPGQTFQLVKARTTGTAAGIVVTDTLISVEEV